jgi:hypothetical protein
MRERTHIAAAASDATARVQVARHVEGQVPDYRIKGRYCQATSSPKSQVIFQVGSTVLWEKQTSTVPTWILSGCRALYSMFRARHRLLRQQDDEWLSLFQRQDVLLLLAPIWRKRRLPPLMDGRATRIVTCRPSRILLEGDWEERWLDVLICERVL